MIDYGTAFQAALMVFFMVVGVLATFGGLVYLIQRVINKTGAQAMHALGGIVYIVLIVFIISLIFRFGGDASMINGLVHGAAR